MDQAIYVVFHANRWEPTFTFYASRDEALADAKKYYVHRGVQVLRVPLTDAEDTAKILQEVNGTTDNLDRLLPYAILTIEGDY